jgi:nucleoside-diphosphate-sugar epimerase
MTVRAVDIKPLRNWHQKFDDAENIELDLANLSSAEFATNGVYSVWNLAADMGGMGFIENNKAACMMSVLINTNLLLSAKKVGARRYFFSSSACVYAQDHQNNLDITPLKESDAYPAMPEDGYGWEKLFSERMCRHFWEDYGLETRVARFHNVYGPFGSYDGGREKAPAAICRKIAQAKISGNHEIEIWGDGEQKRSFMWIDDCIRGILDVMKMNFRDPINLGSAETVSINELVSLVEEIAGIKVKRNYVLNAPQGVRARTSDNSRFREQYGWEPDTELKVGIEETFRWIYDELVKKS